MRPVRRVWTALLLVLTAVVVAGAAYVLTRDDPVTHQGETPGLTPLPGTSSPAASSTTASESPTANGSQPTARALDTVFLGDDYTLGTTASRPGTSWTALVAEALRLNATLVAAKGAGYAKAGTEGTSYGDLVARAVAAHPGLVVVSGGRNDTGDDEATLRVRARDLFAQLRAGLPDATIVAVAPLWGDSPHPAKLAKVDTAVRAAVTSVGGSYLDIADPLVGHPEWMADVADPDDRGYRAIADAVIPALRASLPH